MFAHQAIEDIEKSKKIYETAEFFKKTPFKSVVNVIELIRSAQKIHGGEWNKISHLVPVGEKMFLNNVNNINMPYKNIWFDYIMDNGLERNIPNNIPNDIKNYFNDKLKADPPQVVLKRGILAMDMSKDQENRMICISIFNNFKDENRWEPAPIVYFISLNKNIGKSIYFDLFKKIIPWTSSFEKMAILPMVNANGLIIKNTELFEFYLWENEDELSFLQVILNLLNCKNIQTEKIKAPEALNKKRRKNGKQAIFDYHVLNVVVPGKKRGYSTATEPLSHNRVHLCRGHFKEYTSEHPLFGHLTGLYWWQPHVRGQNKSGIVVKDYNVKTA